VKDVDMKDSPTISRTISPTIVSAIDRDAGLDAWNGGLPATASSYEPKRNLRDPGQIADVAIELAPQMAPFSVMMIFVTMLMLSLARTIPTEASLAAGIAVSLIAYVVVIILDSDRIRIREENSRISVARGALKSLLGKDVPSDPGIAYLLHALDQDGTADGYAVPLLIRIDPVLRRHMRLSEKAGHDAATMAKARKVAIVAISRIALEHKSADEGLDEASLLSSFEKDCLAIADGRDPTRPTRLLVPSARIARIIETAEMALSAHPDLTDGNGARIDALVRVHVPRLLERHAIAAGTASSRETAAVDAALDEAVEGVRASVEEGLSRLHDEAMSALATELRFLSLRRGEQPLLTAVS
jgi:hypothetical protein